MYQIEEFGSQINFSKKFNQVNELQVNLFQLCHIFTFIVALFLFQVKIQHVIELPWINKLKSPFNT